MANSADRCKYCRKDLGFTSYEYSLEKDGSKVCEACCDAGKYQVHPSQVITPKRKKK